MREKLKKNRRVLWVIGCCVLLAGIVFLVQMILSLAGVETSEEAPAFSGSSPTALDETQRDGANGIAIATLPFDFADSGQISAYRCGETLESWSLMSEQSCTSYAQSVLESIQLQELELVEAGFMDLSGECWGCVFKGANDESLMVVLMPERPFSPRSDNNQLVVNVIHYLQPDWNGE